jgi:hypothetical protein
VRVIMARLPGQSIASRPGGKGVRGSCTSRTSRSTRNARPDMGRLIYQVQRQDLNYVRAPSRTDPIPLARAHSRPIMPR